MSQVIFKSDRYFTLFDVMISHGQLLLRSQKDDKTQYNIDIVFFDTTYIQILNKLKSLNIKKISIDSSPIKYDTVRKYLNYENNNLFEIESNDEKYYIGASFFKVFENQLEFNESSLNYENKGREKEIATSIKGNEI